MISSYKFMQVQRFQKKNFIAKQVNPLSPWKKLIVTVHTRRENCDKAAYFLHFIRSTVHTNQSRKQSFPKTLFKPKPEFENVGFAFHVNGKSNISKMIASC